MITLNLVSAVKSNSADAFVAEMPVAISILNANPTLKIIELTNGGLPRLTLILLLQLVTVN